MDDVWHCTSSEKFSGTCRRHGWSCRAGRAVHVTDSAYVVLHADLDRKSEATATIFSSRQGASGSRLDSTSGLLCIWCCAPPSAATCIACPLRTSSCSPFGRQLPDRLQHASIGWRALPSLVDSLRAQALLVAPFLLYRSSAIGIVNTS